MPRGIGPYGRFLIYGLRDPRTGEIRYVGKSTTGLQRPHEHERPSSLVDRTHKNNWVRSLSKDGFRYEIVVLQVVSAETELNDAERWWIAQGRAALGKRFTNGTDGGDGACGCVKSAETRRRLSEVQKGRKAPRELVERRAKGIRAWVATPEGREHLRRASAVSAQARIGRPVSVETRAKLSAAAVERCKNLSTETLELLRTVSIGRKRSAETRRRMSLAQIARRASERTRAF
jgi:hypothetical protein